MRVGITSLQGVFRPLKLAVENFWVPIITRHFAARRAPSLLPILNRIYRYIQKTSEFLLDQIDRLTSRNCEKLLWRFASIVIILIKLLLHQLSTQITDVLFLAI